MNRLKLLTILVLLGLIPQFSFADRLALKYSENKFAKKKQHPAEQYLSSIKKSSQALKNINKRDKTYNRLLIILVGFQEELIDDPSTTGNGQFILEAPENYPINLAKPPHNQEYYHNMADAMKYYYLAASLGSFELEWDIYPQDQSCYTLSHPMSYYNPSGASNEEFISKMEEYFKESLETADEQSPEINFASYSHYMIIHAGSDWQHDVLSDTPSDLPSFFIRVGDGKEAIVDNGSVTIDYACNIPETITQDISEYDFGNGNIQVSGYGALNGVMFHEFGHSLGLVDLYAVNSYYPMVGSFDIMDSGGSVEVGMNSEYDNKIYSIEGIIPALPGAFSRVLMFEDSFRQRGILKDIESLQKLQDIKITCAEERFDFLKAPYLYKLNISQDEYILIENRNVDPDGDGGTAVFTSLEGRVALHPTAYADDANNPTFEYDFLLPSFIDGYNNAIGGGLLIWKINNNVLFNQGSYDSEGNFISNFASNYINTNYRDRGVEIIEADAIPDIGNVYAYHWKGTAFEYYFKNKPIFEFVNGENYFDEWGTEIHNQELNSASTPSLLTSQGVSYSAGISNISNSGKEMTFSYGSPVFPRTTTITSEREILAVSPIFSGTTKLSDIAVLTRDNISLYYFDKSEHNFDSFASISLDIPITDGEKIYPIQKVDFEHDNNEELVIFYGSRVLYIKNNTAHTYDIGYMIESLPQFYDNKYYLIANDKVLEIKFVLANNGIEINELDYQANYIIASDTDLFFVLDNTLVDYKANIEVSLPEEINTKPVIINQMGLNQYNESYKLQQYLVLKSSNNVIYSYDKTDLRIVYDYSKIITSPTTSELALNTDDQATYVLFSAANKVYANYIDGSFPYNYPRKFSDYTFSNAEIIVMDNSFLNNDKSDYYGQTIYLPVEENNYLAWNINQDRLESTLNLIDASKQRVFSHYESEDGDSLAYMFQINAYANSIILQWKEEKNMTNPLRWETNHYNPNRNVSYIQKENPTPTSSGKVSAYIFPSPIKSNEATVRVNNLTSQASLKIFDIAGKLIKEMKVETNNLDHVDTVVDFSNISSGIYIGIVEEKTTYKFKFAVIK